MTVKQTEFQFVVMLGNPLEGWKHYGPFFSWDAASDWSIEHGFGWDTYIIELITPEKEQS